MNLETDISKMVGNFKNKIDSDFEQVENFVCKSVDDAIYKKMNELIKNSTIKKSVIDDLLLMSDEQVKKKVHYLLDKKSDILINDLYNLEIQLIDMLTFEVYFIDDIENRFKSTANLLVSKSNLLYESSDYNEYSNESILIDQFYNNVEQYMLENRYLSKDELRPFKENLKNISANFLHLYKNNVKNNTDSFADNVLKYVEKNKYDITLKYFLSDVNKYLSVVGLEIRNEDDKYYSYDFEGNKIMETYEQGWINITPTIKFLYSSPTSQIAITNKNLTVLVNSSEIILLGENIERITCSYKYGRIRYEGFKRVNEDIVLMDEEEAKYYFETNLPYANNYTNHLEINGNKKSR